MRETCCEEVTRKDGTLDACGKPAVGERVDPNEPHYYPVCEKHLRPTPAIRWRHRD